MHVLFTCTTCCKSDGGAVSTVVLETQSLHPDTVHCTAHNSRDNTLCVCLCASAGSVMSTLVVQVGNITRSEVALLPVHSCTGLLTLQDGLNVGRWAGFYI